MSDATAYNVYYTPFEGVTLANSTKLENVSSPLLIKGLAAGTPHHFVVTAVVGTVETSSPSSSATPLVVSVLPIRYEVVVRETRGIARTNEVVHNGIPLPKHLGLFETSSVHLEATDGTPVDADFEVLSRWAGGVADSSKPAQWLLVTFRASVAANSSTSYFIVSGTRANSGNKLGIASDAGKIEVNTGAARFAISKTSFNVLESLALSANLSTNLAGGATGNATIQVYDEATTANKPLMTAQAPTEVVLERVSDLFATIKVAGYFDNAPYASVKWRYVARYHFFADSPTAILDFSYSFLGNKTGSSGLEAYNRTELARVDKVVLSLPVAPAASSNSYAAAHIGFLEVDALGTVPVAVRQNLRAAMTDAAACELRVNDVIQGGACGFATQPFAGKWGASGGVGATIRQMRWYEPQMLNARADRLDIEIVSDKTRLGPYMGAFAGIALTATGGDRTQFTQGGVRSLVKLDGGLFAWPTRSAVARSEVLDELWDGTAHAESQKYWDQITSITSNTASGYISMGMYGFMTYGLPVREWDPIGSGYSEFGDKSVWDGYFHGGAFTDYHNANGNIVRQFAQSGDSELLNTLTLPAARRTLHTQIVQGDSSSANQYYLGWGPIGYGGYRQNFNGSHSYFDNLYNYYYLTGDKAVLETLLKAGTTLRSSYSRDSGGNIIPSNLPPRQSWMGTVDRASSQQAAIYWFLGHASSDATFLEDFRNNIERGVDLHTALLTANSREFAFISGSNLTSAASPQKSDQYWMLGLYYLNNVWDYYREYGDVALGVSKVTIARLFAGINKSMWDYDATVSVGGTGLPSGKWANQLRFYWTGPIKGGALTGVDNPLASGTSDDYLYLSGKSALPSVMFRAARLTHSQAEYERAKTMVQSVLNAGIPGASSAANKYGWAKETAIRFSRLHEPACYLANGVFGPQ